MQPGFGRGVPARIVLLIAKSFPVTVLSHEGEPNAQESYRAIRLGDGVAGEIRARLLAAQGGALYLACLFKRFEHIFR